MIFITKEVFKILGVTLFPGRSDRVGVVREDGTLSAYMDGLHSTILEERVEHARCLKYLLTAQEDPSRG